MRTCSKLLLQMNFIALLAQSVLEWPGEEGTYHQRTAALSVMTG